MIAIIYYNEYDEDIIFLIFIVLIAVNLIWLFCGLLMPRFKSINDFKPPETESVLKDFFRSLCNFKVKLKPMNRLSYLQYYNLLPSYHFSFQIFFY